MVGSTNVTTTVQTLAPAPLTPACGVAPASTGPMLDERFGLALMEDERVLVTGQPQCETACSGT